MIDRALQRLFVSMSTSSNLPPASLAASSSRAEIRRAQVLEAAQTCFQEFGFHGASISRICRVAGMSPGHVYHYFQNKEEIVAAIVEQDVARILDFHERMRNAVDVAHTVRDLVEECVQRALDSREMALKLEILAEAARNPRIASLVQAADRRMRESLVVTLRALGSARDPEDLYNCIDVMAAMFDGLMTRGVRNPEIDVGNVIRCYQKRMLELFQIDAAPTA